jgi:formylglycine-generating enzyme required for sulfatase activity
VRCRFRYAYHGGSRTNHVAPTRVSFCVKDNTEREVSGGAWWDEQLDARAVCRSANEPSDRTDDLGLRLFRRCV